MRAICILFAAGHSIFAVHYFLLLCKQTKTRQIYLNIVIHYIKTYTIAVFANRGIKHKLTNILLIVTQARIVNLKYSHR